MSCLLSKVKDKFNWVFIGVHDPNDDTVSSRYELRDSQQSWEVAWCVARELNIVRFPSERLGYDQFTIAMTEFLEFINRL